MVTIWVSGQPSAIARCRSAYCRVADSVLVSTCRSVDCRTYRYAIRVRCEFVTFDAVCAVSTLTGSHPPANAPSAMPASACTRPSAEPFGGNESCRAGRVAAGAAGTARHAPSQAATPRCCNTASPDRHPPGSPDRARPRSCSYRSTSAAGSTRSSLPAAFGVLRPGHGSFHRAGMHVHPEPVGDGAGQLRPAGHRIGGPGLPGERHHLVGQLVRPPRPGPGRHQTRQPGRVHRGRGLIERRPGEPERGRRAAHRLPVHPDLAHHLVLHLHQVPRVEELRRGERGVPDLVRSRVQTPLRPQRLHLRVTPPLRHRVLPPNHTDVSRIMPHPISMSRTVLSECSDFICDVGGLPGDFGVPDEPCRAERRNGLYRCGTIWLTLDRFPGRPVRRSTGPEPAGRPPETDSARRRMPRTRPAPQRRSSPPETSTDDCSRPARTRGPPTTSAAPRGTRTPEPATADTGASPAPFARDPTDRAQLTTRGKPK